MVAMLRQHAGFTIIELIVVVMLVAVMASIAAPSFTAMIKGTRIKGVASNLHMALLKARSEAVKRNESVRVQRTGANWTTGWSVVVVSDGTVLTTDDSPQGVTIANADNPANITYLRSGRPLAVPAPFQVNPNPAITSESAKTGRCRRVTIGVSGLPSVGKVDCP